MYKISMGNCKSVILTTLVVLALILFQFVIKRDTIELKKKKINATLDTPSTRIKYFYLP